MTTLHLPKKSKPLVRRRKACADQSGVVVPDRERVSAGGLMRNDEHGKSRTAARRADLTTPADDSLAKVLLVAISPLSAVFAGRSLSVAMADIGAELPSSVRAQVYDLVYGVLRRYGWGDAILTRLLTRPDIAAPVRALLLLALYRLDTRPESAYVVVDNAVDAAGVISHGKAGGLVNAVLRNYLRQRTTLHAEIEQDMSVQYGHPSWWLRRLREAYPQQWKAICMADNEIPPLTLRVNLTRITRENFLHALAEANVSAEPVEGFDAAVHLLQSVRVESLPGYVEGHFAVQDAGAQRAADWLDLADGQRVLDACAAPGGKSCHILERSAVDLLALDIDAGRCSRIEQNLARLGLSAEVVVADAATPDAWWDGRQFDRILVDAPCSASGVVRRHPDAKWLRRSADIPALVKTQKALLDALWPLLESGGKLMYVTCSVFPEENSEQVHAFLSSHPDARCVELEERAAFGVQLLPNAIHDGFYFALFEKID